MQGWRIPAGHTSEVTAHLCCVRCGALGWLYCVFLCFAHADDFWCAAHRNDDWLACARVKFYDALKVTDAKQYHVCKMENWHGDLLESYLRALTRAGANAPDGFSQDVTLFKHTINGSDVVKVWVFTTMEAIEQLFRLQEVEVEGMGGPAFRSMRINNKGSISMGGPPLFVKLSRTGSKTRTGYLQNSEFGFSIWIWPNAAGGELRPADGMPVTVTGEPSGICRTTWPIPPPYSDVKAYVRNKVLSHAPASLHASLHVIPMCADMVVFVHRLPRHWLHSGTTWPGATQGTLRLSWIGFA